MYEKALAVKDPAQPGYKGIKPNYGGGLTKIDPRGRGIGSTHKKMKKLTTVLSKNQMLHSMNAGTAITGKFIQKVNLERELAKHYSLMLEAE